MHKFLSDIFLLKNSIFKIIAILLSAIAFPSFISAQNTLSVKPISTSNNKPISLEIQLSNKNLVTAVQFDLSFSINGVILPLTADSLVRTNRTIDHSSQLSVVGSNTIRVILFNLSNKNIRDTSGTILMIKALSGSLPGLYNPLISNISLVNADGQSLNSSISEGGVTIQVPKISVNNPVNLGRIPLLNNYNNSIYVQNIGNENLIIKKITSSSNRLMVNSSFPTLPYSVSSNNGINFNYTLLPNSKGIQTDTLTISSNDPGLDSVIKVAINYTAYPVNAIVLNNKYVGTYNTSLSIPITINNFDTLAGFQFTLRFPDGIKYIDNSISLNAQRISDHLITANQTGNDLTIMAYSPSKSPLKNNTGEMLTLKVLLEKEGGTYNTTMFGCILSDLNGNNVVSDSSNTQIVITSPKLQLNTSLLNFGSINTKQSTSLNLSINNNGTDTLVINQLVIPFAAITTSTTLPLKIAPLSFSIIRFNFSSSKPLNIDSSITIQSNDPLGDKKVSVKAISFSKNEIKAPINAGFHNSYLRVPLLITNYDTLQGLQFDVRISDASSVRFTDSSFRISEKYKSLNYNTQILDSSNLRVLIFSLTENKILPDSNWLGEIRLQSKKGVVQGSYGFMNFENGIISNNSNLNVASGFNGISLNVCSIVKPSISFSPSSIICDTSVLVTSSIGSVYTLYKNDTIQPLNSVRANVAANWSAIISDSDCYYISDIQSTTIANQNPPMISLFGDSTVCKNQTVTLYSSSKSNNQWFRNNQLISGATDTTLLVNSSGLYSVRSNFSGCNSQISRAQTITINDSIPKPVVQDISYCINSPTISLTATASAGKTLRWYLTNIITDTALIAAPIPSSSRVGTTNYYVSQVGMNGCESDRAMLMVTITPKEVAPTVNNVSYCIGSQAGPLTATASAGNILRWYLTNNSSDTARLTAPTPLTTTAGTTNYYVSQIGANGCESDRAMITVTVAAKLPTPTVSNLSYCIGSPTSPLTATASAGNSLRWYLTNNINDTARVVAPTPSTITAGTTNYYVSQIGANGCESDRAMITVTVASKLPTPTVSNLYYCIGSPTSPLNATASAGNSLRWYLTNNINDTARIVAPTPSTTTAGTTNYYVSQIGAKGCESDRALITVIVAAKLPTPTVNNLSYCIGSTADPLTATASSGNSLRWFYTNQPSDTALSNAPIPSTTTAGTTNFYVSQVGASGCESDRVMITVTVNAKSPTPTVSNVSYCIGSPAGPLTATALAGNTLRWYLTNNINDTARTTALTPSTTTASTTKYYVSQIGVNGCESDRALITVTVNAKLPAPTVSNVSQCIGSTAGPLTANASAGNSLRWYLTNNINDTARTTAPTPSTTTAGTTNYYVSQIGANGCESDRVMIMVTILPAPVIPVVSTNTSTNFCNSGSVILSSNSTDNNQWYKNDSLILGATSQTFTATQTGAYNVIVTNAVGCKSVSIKTIVTVNAIPTKPTITKLGVDLISSSKVGNIWIRESSIITGATDSIYRPLVSGNYRVQVRLNGCLGPTSEPYYYLVTSVVNTNASTENYKLFPNPVSDKILIDAGTSIHKISFQIFDANGRRMMLNTFIKSTIVDLNKLNSGTYTILITNTKTLKQEGKQIIKQ